MDCREMEARRADNQVWNGAGDYQLHPWYRAIGPDGRAPVYLNTIVGLAQREGWQETLEPLLRSFEGSAGERCTATCCGWGWSAVSPCGGRRSALRSKRCAGTTPLRLWPGSPRPRTGMRGRACGGAGGHGLWISPTGRAPVRRLCWTNWNFLKPGAGIRCARGWRTCCTGGTAVPGAARWTSWAAAGWTAAFLPPGSPGRNRGDALRRLSGPGESKGQGGGLLGKKRLSPFWQTKTRERVLRDYVEGCFGASLLSPGELAQAGAGTVHRRPPELPPPLHQGGAHLSPGKGGMRPGAGPV